MSLLLLASILGNPDVAPLLFDDQYKPKPAYFALQDPLARHAGLSTPLSATEAASTPKQ